MDADVTADKLQYIKMLHPDFGGDNVIIWGSGISGEQALSILIRNGINVKYFVDSDHTKSGIVKCGLPVYPLGRLDREGEGIVVVEAMKKWKELDESICNKYEKRFYYQWQPKQRNDLYITCGNDSRKLIFDLGADMFCYIGEKKVYIYGTGYIEKEMASYLELMDFSFGGFLVDEGYEGTYKYIEDILNEMDFIIWVYDERKVEKLNKLGLRYFKDFIYGMCDYDITIKARKTVLDINLGNNYLSQGKYSGFVIYGDDERGGKKYKIVALGNSTTDGTFYPFKSWSQLLYEELAGDIIIYNGRSYGYSSGQEVLKLIRDVLWLKPNMIIVYDGFIDMYCRDKYPYSFPFLRKEFNCARMHIEINNYMDENKVTVCSGIESENERFDNWISNIRTMFAIANERNIFF